MKAVSMSSSDLLRSVNFAVEFCVGFLTAVGMFALL